MPHSIVIHVMDIDETLDGPSASSESVQARLMSRLEVDPESGCWNWKGTRVGDGYGYISLDGEPKYTHRVAAMLFLDFDLASPLWVLHNCDNPGCCNPEHLRAGTPQENVKDAVVRGRFGRGKLDQTKVIEIKELLAAGYPHSSIAEVYGVSRSMIGQIARGESWATVCADTEIKPRRRGGRRKGAESPALVGSDTPGESSP